ncbi:MAG TPA: 16S rRNA (cytidine(1402)-2'-O)-methyltransferase [Gemmatimonadaceae bacterium]|nr:16S rRNA (cytidine(1402)-2'-O)-methyltransferase [Gemmatimonadaceae bacterium]
MSEARPGGVLYIVSTPIGNLGDMTRRAVETLQGVDAILAEDTRHTRHLLDHYGIATPMEPYHEHIEARSAPRIVERLRDGARLALVSDAGTPLLSDPGARLVRAVVDAGLSVVPIPGASALLAALVASGLGDGPFTFFGFPDRKGTARRTVFARAVASPYTSVFYEAPGRVAATLEELAESGAGGRSAVVARELTKQFEELRRGTVEELAAYYHESPPRGEVVILLEGAPPGVPNLDAMRDRARALRADGLSTRDVARALADEFGAPRNVAYRAAQDA